MDQLFMLGSSVYSTKASPTIILPTPNHRAPKWNKSMLGPGRVSKSKINISAPKLVLWGFGGEYN